MKQFKTVEQLDFIESNHLVDFIHQVNQLAVDLNSDFIHKKLSFLKAILPNENITFKNDILTIEKDDLIQLVDDEKHETIHQSISLKRTTQLFDTTICQTVIQYFKAKVKESFVVNPESGLRMKNPIRSSRSVGFAEIMPEFENVLLELFIAYTLNIDFEKMEPPQILNYTSAQEYKAHYDFLPPHTLRQRQPENNQRKESYLIYLNEDYLGGELQFPKLDHLLVKPHLGDVVSFRNCDDDLKILEDSLHCSLPIISGEKWVIAIWVRDKAWR